MLNIILYVVKFAFIFLLYIFIFALIRSVLKDTKLAVASGKVEQKPARLVINFGQSNSKSFTLTEKVTLGRSDAADIQVDANFISHNHAKIYKQGATYVLQDLNSTNGTFIGGKRIKKETLNNGDEITIGKTKLKFLQ